VDGHEVHAVPVQGPGGAPAMHAAKQQHLRALQTELDRLNRLLGAGEHELAPAWQRITGGESRWPVVAAILVALVLQLTLPDQLALPSKWLLPGIEFGVLMALIAMFPVRFDRESRARRTGGLILTALLSIANAWSAVLLVTRLVEGQLGQSAGPLLASGVAIWLTNVIAFAVWYWELDRGGPAARAMATRPLPDFLFAQMQSPELAPRDWEPGFVDYLYLSLTNATAFSPTDVLPMTTRAKLTMGAQSLVSLLTVALVLARAVNVLQ
jgi:uncharacterized membrane protein